MTCWEAASPLTAIGPARVGLWLTPFYAASDAKGLETGNFKNGYEMNYGGAAFGLDYTVSEAFRLGLALSVGGGDTESDGDFNKTTNDFDFFGASLYGAYTLGAFGLTADLGFTGVDGDVKQRVPASMQMGDLKSDTESNAFTFGLIGKYRFTPAENISIAPHLGLRYTKISIDDAAAQAGGGTVFNTTVEDQNLFQIPLGVELSTNILTDSGWKITPKADLGVLFTMGDTDITTRARIAGTNFQTGAMTAEAVDKTAFTGALGIQATADNGLSLGLTYNLQVSPNQTDHQFSGTLRFEF